MEFLSPVKALMPYALRGSKTQVMITLLGRSDKNNLLGLNEKSSA